MQLFYDENISPKVNQFYLNEKESLHAIKVLRLKTGDEIFITDGRGYLYKAIIIKDNKAGCQLEIINFEKREKPVYFIHLVVSPVKNPDRIEWLTEKAVETGVNEISFMICGRTEKKNLRMDRIEKIAESAMKQSWNLYKPKINKPENFDKIISRVNEEKKLIGWCRTDNSQHILKHYTKKSSACILIGPEGDFTDDEIKLASENGFLPVNLGENRLRTETAALTAVIMIQAANV